MQFSGAGWGAFVPWTLRAIRGLPKSFPSACRLLFRWEILVVLLIEVSAAYLSGFLLIRFVNRAAIPLPGPVTEIPMRPYMIWIMFPGLNAAAVTLTTRILASMAAGRRDLGVPRLFAHMGTLSVVFVVILVLSMAPYAVHLAIARSLRPMNFMLEWSLGQSAWLFGHLVDSWAAWTLLRTERGTDAAPLRRWDLLVGLALATTFSLAAHGVPDMFADSGRGSLEGAVTLPSARDILNFIPRWLLRILGFLWFLRYLEVTTPATDGRTSSAPPASGSPG